MKIAAYAGSFNPFTIGHADIVEKALRIFDRVMILVMINPNKTTYNEMRKVDKIKEHYRNNNRVEVHCGTETDITVNVAKSLGACVLVRGIRNSQDLSEEQAIEQVNEKLGLPTCYLFSKIEHSFISSSLIRACEESGIEVNDWKI